MKSLFTKRKALTLATSLSLVTLIVGSTFTWTSLNSQKVNEWRGSSTSSGSGGSLHDDHDNDKGNDPMKDVYIENWGDKPIMARIKLSEYMETGGDGDDVGDITSSNGQYFQAPNDKATPLLDDALIMPDKLINWSLHIPAADDPADCGKGFHAYWQWVMGGQKYYMPATDQQKQDAEQNNGSVVSQPDTVNAGTAGAKQTLMTDAVVTMDQYMAMSDADANRNMWIVDSDGWAYWSNLIRPNTATGMLLSKVNRTAAPILQNYYYAINVEAQMVDMASMFTAPAGNGLMAATATLATAPSPDDFTAWVTGANGTEEATPNAKALIRRLFETGLSDQAFGADVNTDAAQANFDALMDQQ
jgi:hypothetical protein